jgi:putative hydrolase of the HAD superfamily
MTVKAVIWDYGGVITASPFEAFARYETERGLPAGLIRRVNATDPDTNAWAQFERSEIDAAQFDALFLAEAQALGHAVPGREVLGLLAGAVRPRMVAALKACKRRFKVGCITNNMVSPDSPGSGEGSRAKSGAGEVMPLFDAVIESAKSGLRKPDPEIYRMMCRMLEVEPASCVYLDDLGINCKPAAQLGMRAIKVTNEAQALADLAAATGLNFEEEPA